MKEQKSNNVVEITFDSLYSASKELPKTANMNYQMKPLVERRNKRAVDAAIDNATDKLLEAKSKIEKALLVVANNETIDINVVLRLRQEIRDAEYTIEELTKFKEEFFK